MGDHAARSTVRPFVGESHPKVTPDGTPLTQTIPQYRIKLRVAVHPLFPDTERHRSPTDTVQRGQAAARESAITLEAFLIELCTAADEGGEPAAGCALLSTSTALN